MASPRRTPAWLAIRRDLSAGQTALLTIASFLLPLALWCGLAYTPVWKPQVQITDAGGSETFEVGMRVDRALFHEENTSLSAAAAAPAQGTPCNPVYVPAPHQVATALYTAFVTPPRSKGDKWLHEALLHSISIIAWGFALAVAIGVPLGIACGVWAASSRLVEPVVDFLRYMPPPTFGALALAILGINDEPKVAIIVIGILFNMILVVANTTRQVDRSLLEAAATLGARDRQLVTRVVVPAMLPNLWNDLRIFIGVGWTYLTVAEMIGASSGISLFINQQGKYRNYDQVYAGIILIGMVGLITDQILAFLGRVLFPWTGGEPGRLTAFCRRLIARRDP